MNVILREAFGTYEPGKEVLHLYASSAGHGSIAVIDAVEAERIFLEFLNDADDS
jgi:hypothetical protein